MVVGVDGFVDALIAVHPVDAQVVDFVALFAGATYDDRAVQFEAADVGRPEYAGEDVADLLVAHAHAYFVQDTAENEILASLGLSEEHDGERSPELGGKDVAPADCRQLGWVAEEDDVSATPWVVGDTGLAKASTEAFSGAEEVIVQHAEVVNDYHVRFP